jgi:type II secretory ATPase GspE/PulE/Tfp pilus assembly ATPase PilB-like protein
MAIKEQDLIDAVVASGLISQEKLIDIKRTAKRDREKIMDAIMRIQRFPKSAYFQAYSEVHNIPFVQPGEINADWNVLNKMSLSLMQRRKAIPVLMKDGNTYLALSDPGDTASQDAIFRATNIQIPIAIAEPESLEAAIANIMGTTSLSSSDEVDSIALLDDIMKEAYLRRSSDIHIEPEKLNTRIRLRVDGQLIEYKRRLNNHETSSLLNRIKVLAGMDISEQRAPQDGGFAYSVQDWNMDETDFRVAVVPTRWGERTTLRILGQNSEAIALNNLGMPDEILLEFRAALLSPHGMILVTGPTGSGKSTTLYAALREINTGTENILTVEDPIEQELPGVTQVACAGKINFASALRSFLRLDPDIILVGEIRDYETADIAFKASMTGHIVLSTLHTNNAMSAVSRLVDIGCERFLVADSLIGVIAQRLVRRLCQKCKLQIVATSKQAEELSIAKGTYIYQAPGCAACLGNGYKGRIGIFEALWINRDLAHAISQGQDLNSLYSASNQYRPLWSDAKAKVLSGLTSFNEIQSFNNHIMAAD